MHAGVDHDKIIKKGLPYQGCPNLYYPLSSQFTSRIVFLARNLASLANFMVTALWGVYWLGYSWYSFLSQFPRYNMSRKECAVNVCSWDFWFLFFTRVAEFQMIWSIWARHKFSIFVQQIGTIGEWLRHAWEWVLQKWQILFRFHKKFELKFADEKTLEMMAKWIPKRFNAINPFVQHISSLGFDVDITKFPAKNTRKWKWLTVPEMHDLIRSGFFGFPLLDPKNWHEIMLELSLSPYKYNQITHYFFPLTF